MTDRSLGITPGTSVADEGERTHNADTLRFTPSYELILVGREEVRRAFENNSTARTLAASLNKNGITTLPIIRLGEWHLLWHDGHVYAFLDCKPNGTLVPAHKPTTDGNQPNVALTIAKIEGTQGFNPAIDAEKEKLLALLNRTAQNPEALNHKRATPRGLSDRRLAPYVLAVGVAASAVAVLASRCTEEIPSEPPVAEAPQTMQSPSHAPASRE